MPISTPQKKNEDEVSLLPDKIATSPLPPPSPPPLPPVDNLSPSIEMSSKKVDLMSQIKLGTTLKTTNLIKKDETEPKPSTEPKIDMVDQIKIALEKMRPFISK